MKRLCYFVLALALTVNLTIPVWAALPDSKTGPGAEKGTGDAFDYSQYAGLSAEELWDLFCSAEAHKKLYELQERTLRQQVRLLEKPAAASYGNKNSGGPGTDSQLDRLQNQLLLLKMQREQFEWQKKQAENCLRLSGNKMGKEELKYALSAGTIKQSGAGYEDLCSQRYSLQLEEERLELQKKDLEYQYQTAKITEDDFLSQYASAVRRKETEKMKRERCNAEIEVRFSPEDDVHHSICRDPVPADGHAKPHRFHH